MQVDPRWDGQVLNVTGPPSSTLTAPALAARLSSLAGRPIAYLEAPLPPAATAPDMHGLWKFLRAGGFAVATDTVAVVTGRAPLDIDQWAADVEWTSHEAAEPGQ